MKSIDALTAGLENEQAETPQGNALTLDDVMAELSKVTATVAALTQTVMSMQTAPADDDGDADDGGDDNAEDND